MKYRLVLFPRGLITPAAKLRKAAGIEIDHRLIAERTPEGILLRPCVTLPIEMYGDSRIREFDAGQTELSEVLNRRKACR